MRLFLLFLFSVYSLFGEVSSRVDKERVPLGEPVTLEIGAKGGSVLFPDIHNIAGFNIEGTSTNQSIEVINGKTSKSLTKRFSFTPTEVKEFEIPSFEVIVDGLKEVTKPIKISVSAPTNSDSFSLFMSVDKKEACVGEQMIAKLFFKRKKDEPLLDIDYQPSPFEGFWAKQIGKEQTYTEGDFIVHELSYAIFPQKSGTLAIAPSKMRLSTPKQKKDFFGFIVQEPSFRTLVSNSIDTAIKPLPNGIKLFGDFKISASVDKDSSESNKPVNLVVKIEGKGNMDDIDELSLDLKNATVYADKGVKNYQLMDGEYGGSYQKSFSVLSDDGFTIPSFELRYFDKLTSTPKTISTKPIKITITNPKPINEPKQEIEQNLTQANAQPIDEYDAYKLFGVGFLAGVTIIYLLSILKNILVANRQDAKTKTPKTQKEILHALLPYASSSENIDKTIRILEENLYNSKNNSLDKKMIKTLLENLKSGGKV